MEVKKEMQRVVKEQSDVTKAKREGGSDNTPPNDTSAEDDIDLDKEFEESKDLDEIFGDED